MGNIVFAILGLVFIFISYLYHTRKKRKLTSTDENKAKFFEFDIIFGLAGSVLILFSIYLIYIND